MAYKSFTLDILEENFGIQQKIAPFLPQPLSSVVPTEKLLERLGENEELGISLISEKGKSEAIVYPILLEVLRGNKDKFSIFSGATIKADVKKGLNGECDFVFTKSTRTISLKAPVFCLTEAKNDNIDNGIGQCAAQMLARVYNQKNKNPIETVFGCVTNADKWLFLMLKEDTLYIEPNRIAIESLDKILGAFNFIIHFYE